MAGKINKKQQRTYIHLTLIEKCKVQKYFFLHIIINTALCLILSVLQLMPMNAYYLYCHILKSTGLLHSQDK